MVTTLSLDSHDSVLWRPPGPTPGPAPSPPPGPAAAAVAEPPGPRGAEPFRPPPPSASPRTLSPRPSALPPPRRSRAAGAERQVPAGTPQTRGGERAAPGASPGPGAAPPRRGFRGGTRWARAGAGRGARGLLPHGLRAAGPGGAPRVWAEASGQRGGAGSRWTRRRQNRNRNPARAAAAAAFSARRASSREAWAWEAAATEAPPRAGRTPRTHREPPPSLRGGAARGRAGRERWAAGGAESRCPRTAPGAEGGEGGTATRPGTWGRACPAPGGPRGGEGCGPEHPAAPGRGAPAASAPRGPTARSSRRLPAPPEPAAPSMPAGGPEPGLVPRGGGAREMPVG